MARAGAGPGLKGFSHVKKRIQLIISAAAVAAATGSLLAAAPASAAVTCTSPVFKREFFANTTLSGSPRKTDCDAAINQSWGTGAPASGLPYNNFSVRWTVTRDFGSGGPFTFAAAARDGIRVYLDGVREINLWKNVSTIQTKTVNVTIPAGRHTLRVDYANWTGSADVRFGYAPRTSASVDHVKPLTPVGASATYSARTLQASLTWAKNKEMDLAGYRVYRRPSGTSTWTYVGTTIATSYTDIPYTTGQTFYYEVRAFDKAGNTSAGSADMGVTTADKTPPARVLPTVAMGSDRTRESYVVSWKPVPDAARYRVMRLEWVPGGTWTEVASTTRTSVTDYVPAWTSIVYRVEVYDAAGNVAPVRPGDEVYASGDWYPRATDVTASYQGDNLATVQWTVPDLYVFGLDWADYRILSSLDAPSTAETTPPQYCTDLTYALEGDRIRFTCLFPVTPGRTTYLSVEPYDTENARSIPSAAVAVTVPAAPAPATDLTAATQDGHTAFSWTASPSSDVDHYELRSGRWIAATADQEAKFDTYMKIDVPGDATSFTWPYLADQQDFVLIAVAKDGTKLTPAQSPQLHVSVPTDS